jgi:hypothetical protein
MDILEVKAIVRDVIWDWEREHLDSKDCPICQKECTMVSVSVMDKEGEYTTKWRCLNCLRLFIETLKEEE